MMGFKWLFCLRYTYKILRNVPHTKLKDSFEITGNGCVIYRQT